MTRKNLTVKEVIVTSRPFWWINTAAPFFVGYLTADFRFSAVLLLGSFYFVFPYNLFMYGVNDIYDYESDIRNPRKTGIDGSVLAKAKHTPLRNWIIAINLPFWLYFLFQGSAAANTWLAIIIFMALAYSVKGLRFKEIPFVDSFTSSFHYTSPFIFGVLLAGGTNLWLPAFVVFYLWVMANHAFGAIQDITPDKQANIGSIAVSLGAFHTIWFCLTCYSAAAVLPVIFYGTHGGVVSVLLLPYVYLIAQTIPRRRDDTAPIFRRNWQRFLYANYIVGFLLSLFLISLF